MCKWKFISSFTLCIPFIYFLDYLSLTRTPNICWIEMIRIDSFVLFSVSTEMRLDFSPIKYCLNYRYVFICCLWCWGSSILLWVCWTFWKGVEFYQILFLCLLRWSCVYFYSLIIMSYSNWFSGVKQLCVSGIKPTWSWYVILFMCC